MASLLMRCLFCVININSFIGRKPINKQLRWANKSEAKVFAKRAEELGNLGLRYVSACDYLGWDASIRREIVAANKRKARARERRGSRDGLLV